MKVSTTPKLLLIIFLLISAIAQSQVNRIFYNIEFGDSFIEVQKKVREISKSVKTIKIDNPYFPLSKNKEQHLVASMVKLKNGTVKKIVFTFSDDKLSFIQAKGNVNKSIVTAVKGKSQTILNFQVYPSELLYINLKSDIASFLTPKSLHLNLFTWNSPYLNSNTEVKYNPSVKIPAFLKMGESLERLLPILKEKSKLVHIESLGIKNSIVKTQANCYGIEYAGFPRKFEIRFENNKMSKVWILTGKEEENRIRKKLTTEFGKPLFENDNWIVFNDWTVLLRKDKPEVLLITKELGLKYKKQYTE
jgi:hypothetical protein